MKIHLKAAFLLLFFSFNCLAVSLLGHDLIANIDSDGNAVIKERYVLGMVNNDERTEFDRIAATGVNNVENWNDFAPFIDTNVNLEIENLKISTAKASGGQFGSEVLLEYNVKGLADKTEKIGRYEVFLIKKEKFKFYNTSSMIFNLENADLTVILPVTVTETDIIETIPTPFFKTGNTLRWVGTSTDDFLIQYRVPQDILSSLSPAELFREYFLENPIQGATIAIILILLIIYRKKISTIISESLIVEEEIQLPKKEL